MAKPEVHTHNETLEGPLPSGFLPEGREGKVRNVYFNLNGDQVCLIASDRVSAFDQVAPTPILGKGVILNTIAEQELEAAEAAGIETWFDHTYAKNPRAAVGTAAEVLPAEIIFRNFVTGSLMGSYREHGDSLGLGLPVDMQEWHDFTEEPLFTPTTKAEQDVAFHPKDAEEMTGIDPALFERMEAVGRQLFQLGTQRAAERGLVLVDTKYEMGLSPDGKLIVIDEVHTPDSSRFIETDEFNQAMATKRKPKALSKEFLRGVMMDRAGGDKTLAKELMKGELPSEVVAETLGRYRELQAIFTK